MMTLKNYNTDLNAIVNTLFEMKQMVYDPCGFIFTNLEMENESRDYSACTFKLDDSKIKYRKSKITPTKTGQFVTIWKRNNNGIIQPFHESDNIDFVIVTSKSDNNLGQFIFPKNVLVQHKIISNNHIEGKRGLRVYPPWYKTTSLQAAKTQKWQNEYFIEIFDDKSFNMVKTKYIFSQKSSLI